MERRVGIIGTGWVGTSIAISTLHAGVAAELWLNDMRGAVAEGEAMDLSHGAAYYPRCAVRTAALDEMRQTDVVVVAAGRNGRPDESRLDLLRDNARVIASIGHLLRDYAGIVVMVTNPVDVLTRVMTEASGLPAERVLGTGTMLDTARLRQMLGALLNVSTHSIHGQVVGEHGDSEVVLWSSAAVGGIALRDWRDWQRADEAKIASDVRRAAYEVIQRKGSTNHAIGLVTASLLRCLLGDERRVLTVSKVHDGATGLQGLQGLDGVALSLPTVVGRAGATRTIVPAMDDGERAALTQSAAVLRQAIASLAGG